MVRSVHLTIPKHKSRETMNVLLGEECVHGLSKINLDYHQFSNSAEPESIRKLENEHGNVLIIFRCVDKHLSNILMLLDGVGLGTSFGTIDIYSLQSTVPSLTRKRGSKKRKYNYADRQTVREIEEIVDAGSHLTFDFLALIAVGGMIAAVGLLSDSAVTVVASMLVSPLMGPILCVSYGLSVGRSDMVWLGIRNEVLGILLCLLIGNLVGLLTALLFFEPLGIPELTQFTRHDTYYSEEIENRGVPWALFTGLFVAAPTGVGAALAITNTAVNALVGVAISASLLPPLVNSGITMMMGIVYTVSAKEVFGKDEHYLKISAISFGLFALNFACICIFAFLTFRLKGVTAAKREFSTSFLSGESEVSVSCSDDVRVLDFDKSNPIQQT